ncbi:MAG: hypothetical protein N2235_16585 [Fischerella sp.]|nr:hypothetical protein [Fischerella sp.]
MRDTIIQIVEQHPKHYSAMIKRNPKLLSWVKENTCVNSTILGEEVYSAVNNVSNQCEFGNKKKFLSFKDGYGYCGHSSVCKCNKEQSAKLVSQAKLNYSKDKRSSIDSKRASTMLQKYGSKYNLQRDSVKQKISELPTD